MNEKASQKCEAFSCLIFCFIVHILFGGNMERRDAGYAAAYFLSFLFLAIIGVCFSTFVDAKRRVEVVAIDVTAEEGILVQNWGDKGKEQITTLSVKSPKVGVKPASGELNTQTDIPYTVSSEVSSEGAFAKFQITSDSAFEIFLQSCSGVPESELANVKIAVDGSEKHPHSLADVGQVIEEKEGKEEPQKFTALIWLDSHAGKDLVGSKIQVVLGVRKK